MKKTEDGRHLLTPDEMETIEMVLHQDAIIREHYGPDEDAQEAPERLPE